MRTMHPPFVELVPLEGSRHSLVRGIWRLADPKIALASLVPFCVGLALNVRATTTIDPGIALGAFLAIFLVEVGKNAVNDLFDFRSGADTAVRDDERSPFSGGKRVLVEQLLNERDLGVIAWLAFLAAGAVGLHVARATDPLLMLFGAGAAFVSIAYAMPPLHLSYRGLGELAVFAVYGPGIVIGSLSLFRAPISADALVVSFVLGVLIAAVLLANEIPDERADRLAGKRTLVVRLGRDGATSLIGLLFVLAHLTPILFVAYGGPPYLVGALAGVPSAAFAHWNLRAHPAGPPIVGQAGVLVTYVITGLGVSLAALLA